MNNKKVVMISNRVMHYRVPVYNFLSSAFEKESYGFSVLATELQCVNRNPIGFNLQILGKDIASFKREILAVKPDCVIFFLHMKDNIFWPLLLFLRLHHVPVAFWTKGLNFDKPIYSPINTVYRFCHRFFNGLILYSAYELRYVKKRLHSKISVAPNTLNHYVFPQIIESPRDIKNDLNIPFEKVALFVGRMGIRGGRKRVDLAIEAFRQITNPRYGLVIIGSGLSESLIRRMNTKNTLYLGEVHDSENVGISRIMKMADIALIPGHVGLGLNQAFYWGLPVVTALGDQPPEFHYLEHGRNGFVVPEGDVEALKEKVETLFDDEKILERMSADAKHDFLEKASIDQMAAGFINSVNKLLA